MVAAKRRPNLLFLMTDHQRADSLGMVQAGVEVTPNLNRLACRSAVFPRAYAACPLCVPTRTALATGLYPTRTGPVHNDWEGLTAGDFKPIHQYLAEAGYDVAHVGVHHIRLRPALEKRVAFSKWIDHEHYARYLSDNGIDADPPEVVGAFRKEVDDLVGGRLEKRFYSNTRTGVWPHRVEHFKESYFAREAVRFIQHDRSRPFALFVCLWAPHPPLRVPEPYASMFEAGRVELPSNVGVPAAVEPPGRRKTVAAQLAEGVSMEQWRRVWAAHLGLVRLADDAIGCVLEAVGASGHSDDTVVGFTVDHGDHLGQHAMYQKMEMYEPAVRTPLLLHVPGAGPARFETPVSHLDVMPTLLALLELEAPEGLDGVSLSECVLSGREPPDRPVFSQFSGNAGVGPIRRAAVTRRYKYVYDPEDAPELFDLELDPLEMNNLADDAGHAVVRTGLHGQCKAWAETHGDWVEF